MALLASKTVVITGGCGFIGSNSSARFLEAGWNVVAVDNISRRGTEINLAWLKGQGGSFHFEKADVRDAASVLSIMKKYKPDVVLHLAGQVAVTTSVTDPRTDMEINIHGTFNVLDAVRQTVPQAVVIYSSTNKVYGHLDDLNLDEKETRYEPILEKGVSEKTPLEFYSPYGCSKGAADQYMVDFARIYGLKTVTLRQSCIYGYRQFGVEDQGWVAWFMIAHLMKRQITIYGNGKQVRDVLFVDDLVDCYEAAIQNIGTAKGKAYNIGGGYSNSMSLLEFLGTLEKLSGRKPNLAYDEWRPGDQPYYVSDIAKAEKDLGWKPRVSIQDGLEKLYGWLSDNKSSIEKLF
jgi:CDP-paratose 2-epimerase